MVKPHETLMPVFDFARLVTADLVGGIHKVLSDDVWERGRHCRHRSPWLVCFHNRDWTRSGVLLTRRHSTRVGGQQFAGRVVVGTKGIQVPAEISDMSALHRVVVFCNGHCSADVERGYIFGTW